MTVEELKATYRIGPYYDPMIEREPLLKLATEILALVEAVEADRDDIGPHTAAMLDAFNAKLEAL